MMSNHRRFLIDPEQIRDSTAELTGATARQIMNVLRLKEDDTICLLDGGGLEHTARIKALSKDTVQAGIESTSQCANEPKLRLTLAVCLPKGDKLDLIVGKCTELGISGLIVVESERTVARPDASKAAARIARWRKIAAEAVEQSGRGVIPACEGIVEFSEVVERIGDYSLALVAWEDERSVMLREALRENAGAESVLLIVGPEGGLTENEVELARAAGARSVSLGKRRLRTETAAIAACAAIMYEMES